MRATDYILIAVSTLAFLLALALAADGIAWAIR